MILFFAGFLKIIAPGGGDLALSLCSGGWGICPFKKFPVALPGGDGQAWN